MMWAMLQVKGIPFLVFDVGGVLEMFDGKKYRTNVVLEPTLEALTSKLKDVRPTLTDPERFGCCNE